MFYFLGRRSFIKSFTDSSIYFWSTSVCYILNCNYKSQTDQNRRKLLLNWLRQLDGLIETDLSSQSITLSRTMSHDFFSDPLWPLLHGPSDLSPNRSPSPESNFKLEEKLHATSRSSNLDHTLLDLKIKHPRLDESTKKLKVSEKNLFSALSGLEGITIKTNELLQSAFMDSESKHAEECVKFEEFSEELDYFPNCSHSGSMGCCKYRILSKEVKQILVDEMERTSLSLVSKKYGVSINNLCRWKKSCDRRAGAGRKIADRDMEERLIQWIKGEQRKGSTMTRKEIQRRAIMYCKDPNFKASKGWFERFVKRNRDLKLMEYFGMRIKQPVNPSKEMMVLGMIQASKELSKTLPMMKMSPYSTRSTNKIPSDEKEA